LGLLIKNNSLATENKQPPIKQPRKKIIFNSNKQKKQFIHILINRETAYFPIKTNELLLAMTAKLYF
jgi:hypothetical protein